MLTTVAVSFKTVGVVVILFLLSACAPTEETGAETNDFSSGEEEITIGAAWPFESQGDQFEEGLDLAVKEINDSGGIEGHRLQIEKRDDEAEVTRGMEIAQSFAGDSDMLAVIGHRNSYVSIPASEIYEQAHMPMITPASTSPELINDSSNSVFRAIPSDDRIAQNLAEYGASQRYERVVIYYGNHDYGQDLANAFETYAAAEGLSVVDRTSFLGNKLYREQLFEKWEDVQTDAVMIADNAEPSHQVIEMIREYGLEVSILAGNTLDTATAEQLFEPEEEIIVGSTFNKKREREVVQKFIETFEQQYGTEPNQYAAQGYSTIHILKEALQQVFKNKEEISRVDVTQALHALEEVETVTGVHRFNEQGENMGDQVILKRVQEEGFEYLTNR
ncbi:ABC transporter substrate-binding protein [Salibacterium sp. K-3]